MEGDAIGTLEYLRVPYFYSTLLHDDWGVLHCASVSLVDEQGGPRPKTKVLMSFHFGDYCRSIHQGFIKVKFHQIRKQIFSLAHLKQINVT